MVNTLGGFAQKRQLVRLGATDHDLTRAVALGRVIRVRNGWYSTRDADELAVAAVRVGGRLTGLAAIADAGGWTLHPPVLRIAVPRNAARLRSPTDRGERLGASERATVRWSASAGGTLHRVAIAEALRRVILEEPLEVAVAAGDWAFSAGQLTSSTWQELVMRLPAGSRDIRHWVDPRCDSLPESLARTRLRMRGLSVQSQVRVGEFKRIDLVVEDTVALEIDGAAYHRDRFEPDRLKDLEITMMGLHALRVPASLVFGNWNVVERAVLAALRARGRRLPPHRPVLALPKR
jgi:very-short-patch-repair endonuclease